MRPEVQVAVDPDVHPIAEFEAKLAQQRSQSLLCRCKELDVQNTLALITLFNQREVRVRPAIREVADLAADPNAAPETAL